MQRLVYTPATVVKADWQGSRHSFRRGWRKSSRHLMNSKQAIWSRALKCWPRWRALAAPRRVAGALGSVMRLADTGMIRVLPELEQRLRAPACFQLSYDLALQILISN